jgi:hypothetical protein
VPEPTRGVDPRREPEADVSGVDDRGIHPRGLHQRLEPGLLGSLKPSQPRDRKGTVLAHERDDVRDRRQGHEVEMPP